MRAVVLVLACLAGADHAHRMQSRIERSQREGGEHSPLSMLSQLLVALDQAAAFSPSSVASTNLVSPNRRVPARRANLHMETSEALSHPKYHLDRRSLLSFAAAAAIPVVGSPAHAASKIVVFGGSGYVGSYVSQMLLKEGYNVVSVSRSPAATQAEKVKKILGSALEVDYQALDASSADLSGVLTGASAVISCVGIAPGGANQRDGNGLVNVKIADATKAAGIDKFVYISVSSELSNGPAKFLLGDYMKGKAEAEAAVVKDFGANALVVKPDIIAGGPPGEIRPPGPPGVKPVSVEAVAKMVVAGALGKIGGKIDGNVAISGAAQS